MFVCRCKNHFDLHRPCLCDVWFSIDVWFSSIEANESSRRLYSYAHTVWTIKSKKYMQMINCAKKLQDFSNNFQPFRWNIFCSCLWWLTVAVLLLFSFIWYLRLFEFYFGACLLSIYVSQHLYVTHLMLAVSYTRQCITCSPMYHCRSL